MQILRNVRHHVDVNNAEEIPDGEQALGGLCRKIVLNPPPNCGSDFEGCVVNLREQLTYILEHLRGE